MRLYRLCRFLSCQSCGGLHRPHLSLSNQCELAVLLSSFNAPASAVSLPRCLAAASGLPCLHATASPALYPQFRCCMSRPLPVGVHLSPRVIPGPHLEAVVSLVVSRLSATGCCHVLSIQGIVAAAVPRPWGFRFPRATRLACQCLCSRSDSRDCFCCPKDQQSCKRWTRCFRDRDCTIGASGSPMAPRGLPLQFSQRLCRSPCAPQSNVEARSAA